MSKVLILPDTHAPYCDWDFLKEIKQFAKTYKPDIIVQMGDLIDAKAWSRFPKDPDDLCPEAEWINTVCAVDRLRAIFPVMTVLCGNHDSRIMKKAMEVGLPRQIVGELKQYFDTPKWTWHLSPTPLQIDGVAYVHGDELNCPTNLLNARYGRSVVKAHSHQASLHIQHLFDRETFSMEVGWLGDANTNVIRYAAKNPGKCVSAFATVTDGKAPRLYLKSEFC